MIGLLILAIGIGFGWYHRELSDKVTAIYDKLTDKPEPPAVTTSNPLFTNQNQPGNTESMIVEPKSAQLIDWEEQQQLERMNKTVKVKPR